MGLCRSLQLYTPQTNSTSTSYWVVDIRLLIIIEKIAVAWYISLKKNNGVGIIQTSI